MQAPLKEEIYMIPPKGTKVQPEFVWKLKKGLYGLKQSGRNWHEELQKSLTGLGFHKSNADPCLFTNPKRKTYVLVYVDDLLVAVLNVSEVDWFKQELSKAFDITDLGKLTWYLGMSVNYSEIGDISVNQPLFIESMIERFGLSNAGTVDTPAAELRLSKSREGEEILTNVPYRELTGSLMWSAVCTRPDIVYAVNAACRHVERPSVTHWQAAKRILRYLKGTAKLALRYKPSNQICLKGYSDADWAGEETRKSTTGYVFFINDVPISWSSRLQKSRAMSSTEAEYMSASDAALEAVYLRRLLDDMGETQDQPTVLNMDNQGAIAMCLNPVNHRASKHIDLRFHKIREYVEQGVIQLNWVPTEKMRADAFTKPLGRMKFMDARKLFVE